MTKNSILIILMIISLNTFSQNKKTNRTTVNDTVVIKKKQIINPFDVHFTTETGTAVLIGDSIQLLDSTLTVIKTLKQEGDIVELLGETARFHNYYDGPCDGFKFVQIKYNNTEYIINGVNVYKLTDAVLDIKPLKIFKTSFYGQVLIHGEGFEFCDTKISPVVLVDSEHNFKGLVHIIKDDVYYKINDNHEDVSFFQLGANNVYDRITESKKTDAGIHINIKRSSSTKIKRYAVLIAKSKKGYTAQYLEE